jgi:hypothetical protein
MFKNNLAVAKEMVPAAEKDVMKYLLRAARLHFAAKAPDRITAFSLDLPSPGGDFSRGGRRSFRCIHKWANLDIEIV